MNYRALFQGYGTNADKRDPVTVHNAWCSAGDLCTSEFHKTVPKKPKADESVHCGCGILLSDPEKVYYECTMVPKPERVRRGLAKDYVREETYERETETKASRRLRAEDIKRREDRPPSEPEGQTTGSEEQVTESAVYLSRMSFPDGSGIRTVPEKKTEAGDKPLKRVRGRPKGRKDSKQRKRRKTR